MKAFSQLLTSKKKRQGYQLPLQDPPEDWLTDSELSPSFPSTARRSNSRQTSDPLTYTRALAQSASSGSLQNPRHATPHEFLNTEPNGLPKPRGRGRSHTISSSQVSDFGSARLTTRSIAPSPDFLRSYETPRPAPSPPTSPRCLEVGTGPVADPSPSSPTARVHGHCRNGMSSSSVIELEELASFLEIGFEVSAPSFPSCHIPELTFHDRIRLILIILLIP